MTLLMHAAQVEAAWAARRNATGTIVIHDVQANAAEAAELTEAQAADEEFARQLQAKLDAEEMSRNRGRCGVLVEANMNGRPT